MAKKKTRKNPKKKAAAKLALGKFINGRIRIVKKNGRKVVQFQRTK